MDINNIYSLFKRSTGISTDTRTIQKGQLFFALQGENFDGNKYAKSAIEKGAIAAIVSSAECIGEQYVCVDDTLVALQLLARHHRDQFNIPVIGLTGSNGKTTTKELLRRVLNTKFEVLATEGNLNNHIGVPLTLLRLESHHSIAIIEMGANHLEEINAYCQIAHPTHGVITNIGLAHIGEFGGEENILKAKSELFNYVVENEGVVFFDKKEDKLHKYLNLPNAVVASSSGEKFAVQCVNDSPQVQFSVKKGDFNGVGVAHLGGRYNFQNIAISLTVGDYFECPVESMIREVENYIPQNKRSQIVKTDRNTIYLDAYNANPSSMKLAIDYFLGLELERKYLILGDMKELGEYASSEHRSMFEYIQANKEQFIDCFYIGDEFCKLQLRNSYKNTKEFIESQSLAQIENATVFIKGSRSIYLERLVDFL